MTREPEEQLHPDLPPKDPGGNGPPDVPPPPRPHPPGPPTGQPPSGPPPVQTPPPPDPIPIQPPPVQSPPVHTPPPPDPLPPGIISPMMAFLTKPCLDDLSKLAGGDLRSQLIDFVQKKLDGLPPQPFWATPTIDSACVTATLHDGTKRLEERGGIWSSPSNNPQVSLQSLGDVLGDQISETIAAVELYTPALQQIADGLWNVMNKWPDKDTELTGYELGLAPPNQLILQIKGTYHAHIDSVSLFPVGFTATYTISFSVLQPDHRFQIQADTKLDTDTAAYEGVILGMVLGFLPVVNIVGPPLNLGGALAAQNYLDGAVWTARDKVASLADIVEIINGLIPEQVLLPRKDPQTVARKLVFPWDYVGVNPFTGITIWWELTPLLNIAQPRKPSITLLTGGADHQFGWNPDDPFSNDQEHPGYARVPLYAEAIDLRTPYTTITWSVPADYADVLLVEPDTSHAIMYVPVPAGLLAPDWTYPVPLTLHIIDADGLDASVTATLTVYYNQNYTPPPPPQQGPPSE